MASSRSAADRPPGSARRSRCEPTLPQIVVPTSYAGSEMTPILGETRRRVKTDAIEPKSAAGDGDLRRRPDHDHAGVAVGDIGPQCDRTCGRGALCAGSQPDHFADGGGRHQESGARLPKIAADAEDVEARTEALYGAWLCGCCLGAVGMALHHKLCHTLGGTFDLPHAETHAVILPHAIAYNASAEPEAMARIARALGADDAADGLFDLAGAHRRAALAARYRHAGGGYRSRRRSCRQNPYWNPRPVRPRCHPRALIARAFAGAARRRPQPQRRSVA